MHIAWRIPWTEEPRGLQSMRLQRVKQDRVTNTHRHLINVLEGNSQGRSQWLLLGKTGVEYVQEMKWRGQGEAQWRLHFY